MGNKVNKHYTEEFKLRVVKLCLDSGKSDAEISKELGVPATTLSGWKQQYKKNQEQAFSGKRVLSDEEIELKRIKKELERVKEERDILKKALAICNLMGRSNSK